MSPQDIIDALSDYGFTDTTSTRKMEKINATLWDICAREPWPFLETSVNLTFNGSSGIPTNWPTNFQSVLDIMRLDDGTKLRPLLLQEADASMALQLAQTGTATYYYFIGTQLYVSQIPSATTQLQMRYIQKHAKVLQTDPESIFLVPVEHHEVLLYGTLVKLYDLEDDTDLSVRFQQLYESKYMDMRGAIWMRQYDRPNHIQITDTDDTYDFYL